jgi:hypothetical protein
MRRPIRPKSTSQAKARAKARKAKAPKVVRVPLRQRSLARLQRLTEIDLNPRNLLAKVPFVVLVIAALGLGLGVTLWLSTYAAERSYELGHAHQTNTALQQQKEALERDVLEAQAAPALAEAARDLGMIPSRDTAHLLQDPGGNWIVVGTPKPAQGVPPPPLNIQLPDEASPAPAPPPPPARNAEVPAGGTAAAPPASIPEVPVPLAHAPAGSVVGPFGAPVTGPAPGPAGPFPGLVLMPVPTLPAAPVPVEPVAPVPPPGEAVAGAVAPVPVEPVAPVPPPDETVAGAVAPVPGAPV